MTQEKTISLCMITKNEEKFISKCLESVKEIVDEIIIVDTGSIDKTKEIALSFGAKIYDFKWCDDFSAARNESLKHATSEWILFLDADEKLDKSAKDKIKKAVESKEIYGYSMLQLNYTNKYIDHPNFVEDRNSDFQGYYVINAIRLFRRHKDIFFEFYVHELVEKTILKLNKKIEKLDVPIHHYQELKGFENIDKKQQYYMDLLHKNIEKYPQYAINYHSLGILYASYKKDLDTAIKFVKKAIEIDTENTLYHLQLSSLLNQQEKYDESLENLKNALKIKEDEILLRSIGFVYYQLKKYHHAIKSYQRAIELGSPVKDRLEGYINHINEIIGESSASISYSFSFGE